MFDLLAIPSRAVQRALDDLHAIALGLRDLTDSERGFGALADSVRELPATEDELSARIESLQAEIRGLRDWLEPLHRELGDLDDTAEKLEAALARLEGEIRPLRNRDGGSALDDLRLPGGDRGAQGPDPRYLGEALQRMFPVCPSE